MTDRSEFGKIQCKKVDIQQWKTQSSESSFWSSVKVKFESAVRFFDELFFGQNDKDVGHGL